MTEFVELLKQISGLLWGWPALILIAGTGIYLTVRLAFLPIRRLGFGFKQILAPATGAGTIGAGAALATSLSATIGKKTASASMWAARCTTSARAWVRTGPGWRCCSRYSA